MIKKPLSYLLLLPLFVTMLGLGACHTTTQSMPQPIHLTQTDWQLKHLYGKPVKTATSQQRAVDMTLTEEHVVHGFSGCNQFSGQYQAKENRLVFSELVSTMMACFDAPVEEYLFFQALRQTNTYQINKGRLALLDKNQQALAVFEAANL